MDSDPALISPITRDAPILLEVLKEMKRDLDEVRIKVQELTKKVKENKFLTADGISFLETKHLLLLSYCQSVVYYTLRKANGLSIENHPVVQSFVEIRLFLKKLRRIDKHQQYQVQNMIDAANKAEKDKIEGDNVKEKKERNKDEEDPMNFKPNPDMLVPKNSGDDQAGGIYRPPRIAPTSMDEDKGKISKQERQARRREKELLRSSEQNPYLKELMNEHEDRPEELQESVAPESRELSRYLSKRAEQAKQEEELFIRAPVTKREKKIEKHLRKSRNGMAGLTDGFDEVLRMLPQKGNEDTDDVTTFNRSKKGKSFKKHKRN